MEKEQAEKIAEKHGFFNPETEDDSSIGDDFRFWNDAGDMAIIIEDDGAISYCDADGMPCDADGKPNEF